MKELVARLITRILIIFNLPDVSGRELLHETRLMLNFALPIVLSQVGFMLLSSVDSAMIGSLGAPQLAGSAIGKAIFWPVSVFAMGIIYATDAFTARAVGAGREEELLSIFPTCMRLTLILSAIITPLLFLFARVLHILGMDPQITHYAGIYLSTVCWGLPFLLFATAMQRFWQCQKVTLPFLLILIPVNLLNYFANKVLIFGKFGLPALGVAGAAIATSCSRGFICGATILISFYYFKRMKIVSGMRMFNFLNSDPALMRRLLRLGFPSGGQLSFEVFVFSMFTILAAWLTVTEAAAHHVVMLIISFCYMFPLGLANASSFRVGHLIGAGQMKQARLAGLGAILIGVVIMAISATTLLLFPETLFGLFIDDQEVIKTASQIVAFGAFFQILDAIQGCTIGALRGSGNTSYSFIASFIGYYPVALLSGSIFCFYFGWGLQGLWLGMCLGLLVICVLVVNFWINYKPSLVLTPSRAG
jgi:MATE family multidrug resistance protein